MLFNYAKDMAGSFPDVDYFVFGHRHMPVTTKINDKATLIILGDWISHFSYGVFQNGKFRLERFGG
ncbi:UDP-2,3-diacylglucosamine diphosphatase [hydrothermal vent metagenome]|uniref:UDP-2,3-diacylglucosamine diphosphatase n=1 Tax=hydrothermal vent metagenome TaxID=652676 RepID=A0A3B0UXQ7_9ZZZZ